MKTGKVNAKGNATLEAGLIATVMATPDDHAASGIKVTLTAGESLVLGDLVYKKADGKMWKALGTNAGVTMPCLAMCLETIAGDGTGLFLKEGFIRDDSWTSWTVGGLLYVSAGTAGLVTQTPPAASGNQVQIVGYASAAKVLYFNPDYTYVEIS